MKNLSSTILRIGLGIVIIYFSLQQLNNPSSWIGYLPDFTKNLPISQITFVYLNGWFELTFGTLLILGFYTRIVAGLLALHLLGIVFSVGYNPTGMRDFGLTIALFSISLYGESMYSLDRYFSSKENTQAELI
jgi:uncharacterized membrane protein YphA (DoxX/SURF4 family)